MSDSEQELKIKVTVTGDSAGGKDAAGALGQVNQTADELKKKAAAAATETRGLGTEVKHLSQLGHESERVLEGLSRGGLGGIAEAGKAAGQIIRTLATGALGAVLVPAVAIATLALGLMKKAAEENERAIKRAFDNNAKAGEAYAASLEQLEKVSEKRLKEIAKEVDQVILKYKELDAAIDAAAKRQETINKAKTDLAGAQLDAAEKKALLGANSPEEEARIKGDFARRREVAQGREATAGFENKNLDAKVRADAAQSALTELSDKGRELQQVVADADKVAADRKDRLGTGLNAKGEIDTSQAAVIARKEALAARDAAKETKEKAAPELEKVGGAIREQEANLEAARLEVDETALRRQAYQATIEGKVADQKLKEKADRKEAAQKSAAAASAVADTQAKIDAVKDADFKSPDLQHTDTAGLQKTLDDQTASQAATYKAIADHAQESMKNDAVLQDQLQNSREGAGS